MQRSADNLVPKCHVWKETVNKMCFNSIQTGSFDDVAVYKNRVDAKYVDKIFTFVSSCFVDLVVKSINFAQTTINIEIDSTLFIQNQTCSD